MTIRWAYLTSLRELKTEGVGELWNGKRRSALVEELSSARVLPKMQLSGLLFDDNPSEMDDCAILLNGIAEKLPNVPFRTFPRLPRGVRLANSRLQRSDDIVRQLESWSTDLVVCDSYMSYIDARIISRWPELMLNVHPGLLGCGPLLSTPGPTPTRDCFTRCTNGFIFVDDKDRAHWPPGSPYEVCYGGVQRLAIQVPALGAAGVSAHLIARQVDRGRVLARTSYSFDNCFSEHDIRARNYQLKLDVATAAMTALLN